MTASRCSVEKPVTDRTRGRLSKLAEVGMTRAFFDDVDDFRSVVPTGAGVDVNDC